VVAVQRTLRRCEGCGLCCTDAHNGVRILPLEAQRIALHLATLASGRRAALLARVTAAVARYRLDAAPGKVRYTCPFLNPSQECALPLHVKPTACLSFNPLDLDRCAQEPEWFFPTHDREVEENRRAGLPPDEASLPVAVLAALRTQALKGAAPVDGDPESRRAPDHRRAPLGREHLPRARRRRR